MPVINGTAGNDVLNDTAGDDVLNGFEGSDSLQVSNGIDSANGGTGVDYLTVNYFNSQLAITSVAPTVNNVDGGFNGSFTDGAGRRVDYTSIENFTITAGFGDDVIFTGSGNDSISGGNGGTDMIDGGAGNDTISGGFNGDDTLYGGDGNDSITGSAGRNTIYGGDGDDSIGLGAAAIVAGEFADGGAGIDLLTFTVNLTSDDIVFSIADPSVAQVVSGATVVNFERVNFFASDGDDQVTGGAYRDTLSGGFGNDRLDGGEGDDDLRGDNGADTLLGGGGNDNLTVASDDLLVDGGAGTDYAYMDFFFGGPPLIELDISDPSVDQVIGGTTVRGIERIRYIGSFGVDHITGGDLDDIITGGGGDDILRGGAGNDALGGEGGTDELYGGAGDDFLNSFEENNIAGDTVIDGGEGFDYLQFSVRNYTGFTSADILSTDGRVRNVERILFQASSGGSLIFAGNSDDNLQGFDGSDEFHGRDGADSISGGNGNDVLYGDGGNDFIEGGFGSDQLLGGDGRDVMRDGFGMDADLLDGGAAMTSFRRRRRGHADRRRRQRLYGRWFGRRQHDRRHRQRYLFVDDVGDQVIELADEGVDEIRTVLASYTLIDEVENLGGDTSESAGGQTLIGNGLDNVISGSVGNDILDGGAGSDTASYLGAFFAGGVTVSLAISGPQDTGGMGSDTLISIENLTGSVLADRLTGDAGQNSLRGLDGSDILDGGLGADVMTGGFGNDSYFVDQAGDVVIELAGQGNDRVFAAASYTLAAGQDVELLSTADDNGTAQIDLAGNDLGQLIYGNNGVNVLTGGADADSFLGLGGDDQIFGLGGNDLIDGGAGMDLLIGGQGNDVFILDNTNDVVIEGSGQGLDTVFTNASYLLNDDIERVGVNGFSTTFAINLIGNRVDNELWGNDGANFIDGRDGVDIMYGFGGNDIYIVETAGDIVIELAGQGLDTIFTSISWTLDHDLERLGVNGFTTTYAITLTGNELANEMWGNDGANIIDGKAGADLMTGFAGNDAYFVDNANDIIIETGAGGTDIVFASASYALGEDVERLTVSDTSSSFAINLTGNARANEISGNNGANVLSGQGGSDLLIGNGGADTFAFTSSIYAGSIDQILDFQAGVDRIGLGAGEFAGLAPGSLAAGAFWIGSAAADADDRIIYDNATGALYFDADGNGAGAQVQFANMSNGLALTANDFVVI